MTVLQKPYKKKVMPSTIPIIKEEKELYAEIHQSDKSIVHTHYALFQILEKELAKILQ